MAHTKSMKQGNVRRLVKGRGSGKVGGSDLRATKRLGQHFLVDPQIIHKIIACARLTESDLVLEIGPGKGALTLPLARSAGRVVAIEKDAVLVDLLQLRLKRGGINNVTLINDDILKWDFNELRLPPSTKLLVIGNLPYNISSPILDKLIKNRNLMNRAVLMFQLEVAKRLTASPGGKAYGAMTLFIQYHVHTRALLAVTKDAFNPKPKVDSMVLDLDFRKPYPKRALNEETFGKVLKGAFAHRRKTMINSLRGLSEFWDHDILLEAMKKCRIDTKRRAETLTMDDFICLSNALVRTNSSL